jgi:hypothetical protein
MHQFQWWVSSNDRVSGHIGELTKAQLNPATGLKNFWPKKPEDWLGFAAVSLMNELGNLTDSKIRRILPGLTYTGLCGNFSGLHLDSVNLDAVTLDVANLNFDAGLIWDDALEQWSDQWGIQWSIVMNSGWLAWRFSISITVFSSSLRYDAGGSKDGILA